MKKYPIDQLRFLICGSVDDGKSTLLGRILYDVKTVTDDQVAATLEESRIFGTQGKKMDFALLVDGLQAEREQGITIDIAYRYFTTAKRKFVAVDAPGHEQYTRNMASGASNTELAIILVDARKGILDQTRRHSFIISFLGIRHAVLVVNKMDLVAYDQAVFDKIKRQYNNFAKKLDIDEIQCIPVCALMGENIYSPSLSMPWYKGSTLIDYLETVNIFENLFQKPFRMPVQWVNRSDSSFRGFSGTIASGTIKTNDTVMICPSGKTSKVARIVTADGDLQSAYVGQAPTLVLADEIDISRGDILADSKTPADRTSQFAANLLWMHSSPLLPERQYDIRFATQTAIAKITKLHHQIDVNSLQRVAAKTLVMNEIGNCNIALNREIAFDTYDDNRQTGAFILIDRISNTTVGAGTILFGLQRNDTIGWHHMKTTKEFRAERLAQKPCVLWFTGLSGSGKSTIADYLEQYLQSLGKHTYILDGDNIRHALNKDLGFTNHDRVENIRRVGEVAKLFVDAGLITLVSLISPFSSERRMVRSIMKEGEFIEIFIDTPLAICEKRDPKGLYKKARAGNLKNFTGVNSNYEIPENAEIILKGDEQTIDEMVHVVSEYLRTRGIL